MAEQQLQLGNIEQMDGQGQPVVDEERALYEQSLQAPLPTDDYLDGTVDETTDPTLDPLQIGTPASDSQLQGAAEIYNMAMAFNATPITPDDVRQMTERDITPYQVVQLLDTIKGQSKEAQRQVALGVIAEPRLQVEAKMELLRFIDSLATAPDVHMVDKQAQSVASREDYNQDDEPDAQEAAQWREEQIVSQPRFVEPEVDDQGMPVAPEDIFMELQQLYEEADNKESFLDYVEMMTPIGALPTLNKVVADIYSDLNITNPNVVGDEARPWVGVGLAFQELRAMVREASPEQKEDIARVVLKRLKENTGLFQDNNDLVTMQVLENLFSQEIFGESQYEEREREKSPEEIAELDARIAELDRQIAANPSTIRDGGNAKLVEERDRLVAQRNNIPTFTTLSDNVFNLLDLVFLGSAARATGRVFRKLPSFLERMSRTAPESAANRAAAAVLDESGELAARMGTTPLDLVDNFLPSGADDIVLNRGINGFAAMTQQMREQAAALARSVLPVNLTHQERAAALADISSKYDPQILAKNRTVKLHLNQSSVQLTRDGNGAAVTAIFGATPHRGWATLRGARRASQEAAEEVFGADVPVEIVRKNQQGLFEVVPADAPDTLRGEFYQRVRDVRSLASSNTYGTIGLADDAVDKLTMGTGVSSWTRGLNIFNDFHYDQISSRVREASFNHSVWMGLLKPIGQLKQGQKQLLSKIVRENEGTELADDALEIAANGDRGVMDGYRRFISLGNIAYHLEDQLKRTDLLRRNMRDLYHGGQRIGFGAPVEQAEAMAKAQRVFDPQTGQYTRMKAADVEQLYKRGGSLARLNEPLRGSENLEDALMLIDPRNGSKMRPVPVTGTLARIPGYYPHMYNRNYIVSAVDKAGRKVPKAVSFTAKSARDFVQRKNAQIAALHAKGKALNITRYEEAFAPEIRRGETFAQHLDELESGFSQIMFGHRSNGALKELDNAIMEAELDPLAAMMRATEILSTRVSKGEMLQSMRHRLWNSLHKEENKKFLKPGAERKSYNQLTLDDLVEDHPDHFGLQRHRAMLHKIDTLERSPDFWEAATKASYRIMAQVSGRLADKFGGKALRGTEQGLYRAAKDGPQPVRAFLGWMHRMYISAMAPKQFVLGVMQAVATAGMLSPARFTQAVWQTMGIVPAILLREARLHDNIPGIGKFNSMDFFSPATGLSRNEFRDLVSIITERGLLDSVGSNTMVKSAIQDAADAHARSRLALPQNRMARGIEAVRDKMGPMAGLTRARTYDQAIFGTLNKIGWEGGERLNQVMSLLTLYNRDKAAKVADLKSSAYVDSLIGRTAELTGNMVKEAGFGYTSSVLKPIMLWIPFQHKMILQAIPRAAGGMRRFSADEKARMVFGQFLLYGANATVMAAAVHQAIERGIVERLEGQPGGENNAFVQFWRDQMTRDALEGLVFDHIGNNVIKALWGTEGETPSDMAWGKAFAPGAGHEFVREKVLAMASADWENALSVQGTYTSKFTKFIKYVSDITTARWKDVDQMPWEQRRDQMLQRGLTDLLPLYGKWVTARWAVEHGRFISENGVMSEPFDNEIEAKLSLVLGVDSKDRASYYESVDRIRNSFEDEGASRKAAEDAADVYWKNLLFHAVKFDKEVSEDGMWDSAMDQYLLDQGILLSVLSPRERQVFNSRIEAKMDELARASGDSAERIMLERLTNKLADGGFGEKGPQLAAYLRHLPWVEKNPQFAAMVEQAWSEIVDEPAPQNLTEDMLEGND